jgi:diguanylate cyclase (GGDEF)-like protein
MTTKATRYGSGRLMLLIKSAYWVALSIIALMAMASYLFLQQMLAAHERDQDLLALTGDQKALSQRVVMLANAAEVADTVKKRILLDRLKSAVAEFEVTYDRLYTTMDPDPTAPDVGDPTSVNGILFGRPYHLDYFSTSLAANGRRLAAAMETQLQLDDDGVGYLAGSERATLDEVVATAALNGYAALGARIESTSSQRIDSLLRLHRNLFFSTIGVIALIALFIFRPMSNVILRRTRELIDARNAMAHQAVHDGLTGLHNRSFLTEQFEAILAGAARRGERVAAIQIDLDRFKQTNDTLGHAAGDQVLFETAQRIRQSCRASDMCVRLGGDEFVVILTGAGQTTDIDDTARRILNRINEPIAYHAAQIMAGASAGIAVFPDDAGTSADLLVHADLALYTAKKQGGNSVAFFSDDLRKDLEHRKRLESDLREAIRRRAFAVYFQPQVSIMTSEVTGVEALVRWTHPERGTVSPAEFIPAAEKSGLMPAIGRIIVEQSIEAAAGWHRAGIEFGRLAVNVSGAELREPEFEAFLFSALKRHGLPHSRLSLEIVESVILDDEKTGIAARLRRIRAEGVHLELDDFGTGYASLSHVNPNEIDRLKIDRRFVQNIHANADHTMIVRAIAELAKGLGISIVAEGAETSQELDALLELGCEQVQGYSIAFPMPEKAARDWLVARNPKRNRLKLVESRSG